MANGDTENNKALAADSLPVVIFSKMEQWHRYVVLAKLISAARLATKLTAFFLLLGLAIAAIYLWVVVVPQTTDRDPLGGLMAFAAIWSFLFAVCALQVIRLHSLHFTPMHLSGKDDLRPFRIRMEDISFLGTRFGLRNRVITVSVHDQYGRKFFSFVLVNDDNTRKKLAELEEMGYAFRPR